MKRLQDNLTSSYIESANRLKPKSARCRIVAYVESYDDVYFWRTVLEEFETDKLYFEVMLPSRTTLSKGKKSALMNRLGKGLGGYMIACVDADYDWLMQGATPVSHMLCTNPYVLHTYVYAIENYQCYAPALHTICVMSTLNDRELIDLEAFMTEYSRIVWPLFVWNIWAYRYERYTEFSITDFCEIVSIRDINPYHPENALEYVKRRVNKKVAWLQRRFPEGKKTYAPLRQELQGMGLTPETCYLYMQGHTLFGNVVMSVLTPICTLLRKEREKEINNLADHSVQRQNELACYQHSQSPVDLMLRKSVGYKECAPYQLLRADIKRLMEEVGLQK
ncbi:MAG: DUF4435 domain-containing protein [Bacteroidaceae bacterium]|nr:DUF4435 domain-containing protein [Bacteroidaceae bacterium]